MGVHARPKFQDSPPTSGPVGRCGLCFHLHSRVRICVSLTSLEIGRRVHVQNGNVAQAIAALNRRLNHNNVQRTSVYQRRHEKRGYRRRRLQAQKWRRMFAYEVRTIVPPTLLVINVVSVSGQAEGRAGAEDPETGWLANRLLQAQPGKRAPDEHLARIGVPFRLLHSKYASSACIQCTTQATLHHSKLRQSAPSCSWISNKLLIFAIALTP